MLQLQLGCTRTVFGHLEVALHPVGTDFVRIGPVAGENAELVLGLVELGVVRQQHGGTGAPGVGGQVALGIDVLLQVADAPVRLVPLVDEGGAAEIDYVQRLSTVQYLEGE